MRINPINSQITFGNRPQPSTSLQKCEQPNIKKDNLNFEKQLAVDTVELKSSKCEPKDESVIKKMVKACKSYLSQDDSESSYVHIPYYLA